LLWWNLLSSDKRTLYNHTMSTNKSPSSINDDEALEPARKKLRSCEPDLKITIGGDVGGINAVDYWCHASVMATHSNLIDTMLSSGMKESNTYEVSFPDIAPATWESMMKFLDKPLAVRLMTVEDVMEVATGYDRCDFPAGRELCSHILAEYIHALSAEEPPDDLDFCIDAILLADALHLDEAKNGGVLWVLSMIMFDTNGTMFSRDHIAKLAPLISREDILFLTVKHFVKSVETKDDILHRLFPELFVETFASSQKGELILKWIQGIALSGSGCNADGLYWYYQQSGLFRMHNRAFLGEEEVLFRIRMRDDIWVISGLPSNPDLGVPSSFVEKILWKCPHIGTRLMFPPKDGWVPVDELARGKNPTLKYQNHLPEE
jgi:hypothetical protein